MKIKSYIYRDSRSKGWSFSEVKLRKLNLLVGNTGAGKTRFLNTIFSLGLNVTRPSVTKHGYWHVCLEHKNIAYQWEVAIEETAPGELQVTRERLCQFDGENSVAMIRRDEDSITFFGEKLPKLTRDSTSLTLFKEDDRIKPLHEGFASIMKRNFSSNELDEHTQYQLIFSDEGANNLAELFRKNLSVNWKLHYLAKYFPARFKTVKEQYAEVFPFIREIALKNLQEIQPDVRTIGNVPVFCIKEKNVNEWIPAGELSSGMRKVLLIMTDIHSLPDGAIYLIDEYENSLGINAINFFPTLLAQVDVDAQFIVTSHHPYIINNIPAEDWLIFHRRGQNVMIRFGEENARVFGRSKQQRFTQLLNDPFYNEGIE